MAHRLYLAMNNQAAYNTWAKTYDTVRNQTRDVEARAIRQMLVDISFEEAIEIGCGTGKNTEWLATKAAHVTAVDFSVEMLAHARTKIASEKVHFQQADITQEWGFVASPVDLVTCSLILEHIQDLGFVFRQASRALKPGGLFYVGELHPFKQYQGSKARFDKDSGTFVLDCFTHHLSDYMAAALQNGFSCVDLQEWFDDEDRNSLPRIVSFVFRNGSY